jgi:hypothetical protein
MRYMMFIKHAEDFTLDDVPPSLFPAMGAFVEAGLKSGAVIDTAGLQPTKAGTKVQLSKGKIRVLDGPFTESKEVVGGYALVEFPSQAEALAFARKFMELHLEHWPAFEGECEVRPLEAN